MKLRIKGNSLRLRITPSEMTRFIETGRIEETIHFAADENACLTYALQHSVGTPDVSVRYSSREIAVILPSQDARNWAAAQDIGVYAEVHTSDGSLALAIEKDFACLDKSDAENADTFPHPKQGSIC